MELSDFKSHLFHELALLVIGIKAKVIILTATNVCAATTSTDQYSLKISEGLNDSSAVPSHLNSGGCYE
ncbi:MAG: hypothetical protein AB8C40_06000 [Gammaproteobacteria bacterium]